MNCERASSLAAPDHRGKSLPPTLTPPRSDLGKSRASGQRCESRASRSSRERRELSAEFAFKGKSDHLTYVFSSIWQKSAQVIDSIDFQVPLFCDTCALFGWKPSVFSMLTKTPPIMNVHVVESGKWKVEIGKWRVASRREEKSPHAKAARRRSAEQAYGAPGNGTAIEGGQNLQQIPPATAGRHQRSQTARLGSG